MRQLTLRDGDTLTIVDNRGVGVVADEILVADEVPTSYFARNAGAARGRASWIVFLDSDVEPPADLLDRLLGPALGDRVGVLAGGVVDVPVGPSGPPAIRYAELKSSMSQEITLGHGEWAFAQTANATVRRDAFEAVGGFSERARSGGDADLCWRLRKAGWELVTRPDAAVMHRNRSTVPRMLAQRFRHGSGAAWLGKEHPGALPARRWPGLALWSVRRALAGLGALARGDRDGALLGLLDGPAVWAFELGRLVPNRPLPVLQRRL